MLDWKKMMHECLIDNAISALTNENNESTLCVFHETFISETIYVPVDGEVKKIAQHTYDLPLICLRGQWNIGAIPVFTTMDHLFRWEPRGCSYVPLIGRELVDMAINMSEISEIVINPADTPCWKIPRAIFELLSFKK